MLGADNIERMRKQKRELDNLRDDIDRQEREKAALQLKTDVMKGEYLKLNGIKDKYKTEIEDVKKRNVKLQRKIDIVQLRVDDLRGELEGDTSQQNKGFKTRAINPRTRKKLEAEQKKRQRELLKRKLEAGIDILGEDNEVNLEKRMTELNFFERLITRLFLFLESLKPFKSDINYIRANYDQAISQFFEIVQYVYICNLITAIAFAPLLITQYFSTRNYAEYKPNQSTQYYFAGKLCGYAWPCQFFFSRYQDEYAALYAITPTIYGFFVLIYLLGVWIQFDKKAQYQRIFQDDIVDEDADDDQPTGKNISRQFFLSWTWTINNETEYYQKRQASLTELDLLMQEDLIKQKMRARTPLENNRLRNQRYLATFINIIIILIGWSIIFAGTYFEN